MEAKEPYVTETDYIREAMDLLSGTSLEIQPPTTKLIYDRNGLVEVEQAAWVKFNVSFLEILPKLRGAKLPVFICIALHVGKDCTCFPSVPTIAKETGYTQREVYSTIAELDEMGLLTKKTRTGKSNIYLPAPFVAYGKDNDPWSENEPGTPSQTPEITSGVKPTSGVNDIPLNSTSGVPLKPTSPEEEPIKENQLNTEEVAGKKQPARPRSDPRTKHPAIQLFRQITRKLPNLVTYERVITVLGSEPDAKRAATCYEEWVSRGFNVISLGWLDWYRDGIPARPRPSYVTQPAKPHVYAEEY